ncbi:MAG: hypothetical protein Q9182_005750 [Xanthomendoza sp. 2 TL-2023]
MSLAVEEIIRASDADNDPANPTNYFNEIKGEGNYAKHLPWCRIAMLAVYMSIIRRECQLFVGTWNSHYIRTQKHRNNSVKGRPNFLYEYPEGAKNYAIPPDAATIEGFLQRLPDCDLNEYLPPTTLNWCHEQIRLLGEDPFTLSSFDLTAEGLRRYKIVYYQLELLVEAHMTSGSPPRLSETLIPHARNWKPGAATQAAFEDNSDPRPYEDLVLEQENQDHTGLVAENIDQHLFHEQLADN